MKLITIMGLGMVGGVWVKNPTKNYIVLIL